MGNQQNSLPRTVINSRALKWSRFRKLCIALIVVRCSTGTQFNNDGGMVNKPRFAKHNVSTVKPSIAQIRNCHIPMLSVPILGDNGG